MHYTVILVALVLGALALDINNVNGQSDPALEMDVWKLQKQVKELQAPPDFSTD